MIRVFLTIIFFLSIFFTTWWVSLFFAVLLVSFYQGYAEVFIGMLLLDGAFGVPTARFFGIEYLYSIIALVMIFCSLLLRRVMME